MFLIIGFICLTIGVIAFFRLALTQRISRCIFEMPIINGKENTANDLSVSPSGACRIAISAEISGDNTTLISSDTEALTHQLQYYFPMTVTLFGAQGQTLVTNSEPLDSNINTLKTVEFNQTNEDSGRTHFEVAFGKFTLSSKPIQQIIAKIDPDSQYQSQMANATLKIYDHLPRPFLTLAAATFGTAIGIVLIAMELMSYVSEVIR